MTRQPDGAETFDLTDRSWIRVLDLHGNIREVSVHDLFTHSRDIRRIAGDSPQQDAALLRLLLVVYWRAHRDDPRLMSGDAGQAVEWWCAQFGGAEEPASQERISTYLDRVRERWDLLHPTQPFFQVADLHTLKGEHSPVRKLVPDAESPYFSMRAAQGLERLDLAEAARWLVHLQAWNYSGIKSGAVGDPRVKGGKGYPIGTGWSGRAGGVILHGRTLAETLVLNTVPDVVFGEDSAADLPVWERKPATAAPRPTERPVGPCDLLTWQIRRARLFADDGGVTGVLVANGDRLESQNEFSDPMTAYRLSEPQSKKAGREVWMPRAHASTRTLWRGLEPLLAQGEEASRTVRVPATVSSLTSMAEEAEDVLDADLLVSVQLVGAVYGTQDAVVAATVDESMPLRLSVLMQDRERMAPLIVSAAEATMQVAIALGQFAGGLRQAAGADYAFVVDATESLLDRLSEPFKDWLAGLTAHTDLAASRSVWFGMAERVAREQARALVAGVGPNAIVGREDDDGRLVSVSTVRAQFDRAVRRHFGPRSRVAEATHPTKPGDDS